MKIFNNTSLLVFATLMLALSSCEMKKELFGGIDKPTGGTESVEKAGMLDLELKPNKEADIPESKGGISGSDVVVIDVNDFAVDILDSIGQVYKHYESYADLKKEGGLFLPEGKYAIKATLGEDVNAGFDSPFYSGINQCEITPKEVAKVITNCVLSNKKVQFRCSDEFMKSFEDDYSIVVDNGNGALTTFKDEKRASYLKSTGTLQFTIYTTTRSGKKNQVYNIDLSKKTEVQEHNNILVDLSIVKDDPNGGGDNPGGGGDDPSNPDEPEDPGDPEKPEIPNVPVKGPTIKVDISLIEKDYVIEIPSNFVDSGGESPEDPEGPVEPSSKPTIGATLDGKAFSITTTQNVTPSSKVVIQLTAPGGLKTLMVRAGIMIDGTMNMMDLDIFNLDPVIAKLLEGMNLPEKDKTTMQKFDISPFMAMLGDGENTFEVTMTDNKGAQGSGKITLKMKK